MITDIDFWLALVIGIPVGVAIYRTWYQRPRRHHDKWRCVCGWCGEEPTAEGRCPRCFRSNLINDL